MTVSNPPEGEDLIGDPPTSLFLDNIEKETRFAVVLYGGVSLAVYISGVCQELLAMVRATAAPRLDKEPTGSEIAYRLASLLVGTVDEDGQPTESERIMLDVVNNLLTDYQSDNGSRQDRVGRLIAKITPPQPDDEAGQHQSDQWSLHPKRRFVVDVLSGSSAGGLNAIYLSKALTHDTDIDHLKKLWVEQGGFSEILNDDAAATKHNNLSSEHTQIDIPVTTSLLSGDLMLLKLLNALEQMDRIAAPGASLVDALDCYLTTTDLRGLLLPVRLTDEHAVPETRHRSVFHLAFARAVASGGDFDQLNRRFNRHLAFIARATSAHPAAFDAAQAQWFADGLQKWVVHSPSDPTPATDLELSRRITPRRIYGAPWEAHMPKRWYSDGGSMDNKPFTYVLEPLRSRRAEVPVNRQLLFVEPDPNDARPLDGSDELAPTFMDTTLTAFNLGRKENIREDIEGVLNRNTTIRRLQRGFDDQVGVLAERLAASDTATRSSTSGVERAQRRGDEWVGATYGSLIDPHADTDLSYEFHKTVWLGGELGETMAKVAGFATDSAQTRWITDMTQQFMRERFVPRRLDAVADEVTLHRPLLRRVDLGYRLRRLMFVDKVLRRLQVAHHDGDLADLCAKWRLAEDEMSFAMLRSLRRDLNEVDVDLRCVGRRLRAGLSELASGDRRPVWDLDPDWRTRWADDLSTLNVDESLHFAHRATLLSSWPEKFTAWTSHLRDLGGGDRVTPYRKPTEADMRLLDDLVEELGAVFESWFIATSKKALLAIDTHLLETSPVLHELVLAVYEEYSSFDHFVLPSWGEARGELAEADVTRVSPLDATRLMSVSKIKQHEIHKLTGNSLNHFGGFLREDWRRNDILWGRLDAAEIVLGRLLPDENLKPIRDRLIDLAHDEILVDEWATVRTLPELSAVEPTVTLPVEADPDAARRYINNGFSASLDPSGSVNPSLVGRVLDVLGRMAHHHGIDQPARSGANKMGGQLAALVVRILRLAFPTASRRGKLRLGLLQVVYLVGAVAGVAAIFYGVGLDLPAGVLTLVGCLLPLLGFIVSFVTASVGRSKQWNAAMTVATLAPIPLFVYAATQNSEALFAVVSGFGLIIIVALLALPSLVAKRVLRRFTTKQPHAARSQLEFPDETRVMEATPPDRTALFDALIKPVNLLSGFRDVEQFFAGERPTVGDRFTMRCKRSDVDPNGSEQTVMYAFEFIELVADRRIVIRWGIRGDDVVPVDSAIVSIQLRENLLKETPTTPVHVDVHVTSTFDVTRSTRVPCGVSEFWFTQLKKSVTKPDAPVAH